MEHGYLRLYLIVDLGLLAPEALLPLAGAAIAGGVTALQLRAKGYAPEELGEYAAPLARLAHEAGVPLIINDYAGLASAIGAAGVHLGSTDMPVQAARALLPQGIIGYSPEDLGDAWRAIAHGADYLGVGPFAATATKHDAGPPIGQAGIRRMAGLGAPIVAIGGISAANAGAALQAGACGVAVASAILTAADPRQAAQNLSQAMEDMR